MDISGALRAFTALRGGRKRGEARVDQVKRADEASEEEKARVATANSMKYLAMQQEEARHRETIAQNAKRIQIDEDRAATARRSLEQQIEAPRSVDRQWVFNRTQQLIKQGMSPKDAAAQANFESGERERVAPNLIPMPPSPARP